MRPIASTHVMTMLSHHALLQSAPIRMMNGKGMSSMTQDTRENEIADCPFCLYVPPARIAKKAVSSKNAGDHISKKSAT